MANYDVEYFAKLNDDQVLAALLRIDKNINKLGADADREFQKVGKSAGASGAQIGAITGVVSSLTTEFINLGKKAVDAFIEIGKQSVQAAIAVDTIKARLNGIFAGNKEAAGEAFDFIQSRSVALGIDLKELAGAFLPKSESLEQFERIAKVATALARSDPEQGAIGARIALIEAQSGTFTSLQRRFEIPRDDINKIKKAFEESGTEGFITELEEALKRGGRSFEDYANTAQTSFSRIGIASEQIKESIGKPIVEELEKLATAGLDALGTLKDGVFTFDDDVLVLADTIGRTVSDVIGLIGDLDFGSLDASSLQKVADYIFRIINAIQLAGGQFLALAGSFETGKDGGDLLYDVLTNLDDALVTLAQILALTKASFAAADAGIKPYLESLKALAKFATGDVAGGILAVSEALNSSFDLTAGQDAFNASILESQAAFDEYNSAVAGNKAAQDDLRDSLGKSAEGVTDNADAVLAAADAQREAAAAAEELEEAQGKVNEAFAEAQKDFDRKIQDIDIETARKRLDIATEFAQKRVDQARKNLQALADLETKYQNDVDAAATDLARNEEDIARKHGREQVDLEREQRQSRLDIELDYQRRLQDITRQSNLDLDEAAQARDAVSFVKILKKRNEEITQAGSDRNKQIADLQVTGEQKRTELQRQQEQELEDARIANERKLEDLRTNLDQQIEAQNLANQRTFDDLALAEERKNEELTLSQERQIEDANRAYERKKEDLSASLADELAIIAAGNAATEAEQARHIGAMNEINAGLQSPGAGAGFGANPGTIATSAGSTRSGTAVPGTRGGAPTSGNTGGGGFGASGGANVGSGRRRVPLGRRRAAGGPVVAGQEYVVGEGGPEVIVPGASGMVIPNGAIEDVLTSFQGSVQHGAGSGGGATSTAAQQAAGLAAKRAAPTLPSAPGITSNFAAPAGGMSVSNVKDITVNLPMVDPSAFIGNPIVRASIENLVIKTVDKIV